jgi:hypothetical protein
VTEAGTALVDAYIPLPRDLTSIGGPADATILDWRLEEIDIASGKLLFSWNALDHVALEESVMSVPTAPGQLFDYFHGNSIDVDIDSNLIVSARNTSTIYKIDRTTGEIIWRLPGAKRGESAAEASQYPNHDVAPGIASDAGSASQGSAASAAPPAIRTLTLLPESESFWFQHDARHGPGSTLSLFDDGGAPFQHNARGLVLAIDEAAGTATIRHTYDGGFEVDFMGSFREQPNGNWLVGWGGVGRVTEYNSKGQAQLDADFAGTSYRALRSPWTAVPAARPDLTAEWGMNDQVTAWASWNGATEVRSWRLLSGDDSLSLSSVGTFAWDDFETEMSVQTTDAMIAVEALDGAGQVLARSALVTARAAS